jgi:hypothetical protein
VTNPIKVFYLRDMNNHLVAAVASTMQGNTVAYAVATHNPKDPFNKKVGRAIAIGRLASTKHVRGVEVGASVKRRIMEDIIGNSRAYLARMTAKL